MKTILKLFVYAVILMSIFISMFMGFIIIVASINEIKIPKKNKVETEGVITSITEKYYGEDDYSYDVLVSYEVNGVQKENLLGMYSDEFYEGMKIDIVYDKTNPDKILYEEMTWMPFLAIGIGIAIIIKYIKSLKKFKVRCR